MVSFPFHNSLSPLVGIGDKLIQGRSPPGRCKAPGHLRRDICGCVECKQQGQQRTGVYTGVRSLHFDQLRLNRSQGAGAGLVVRVRWKLVEKIG